MPVPAAFKPVQLPSATLPVVPVPSKAMPASVLPETRLRSAAAGPPIVLLSAPEETRMPELSLATAAVPAAFVPM